MSWTQARATSNVTLNALLSTNVGPTTMSWYVTTAIGAGATIADVVYSGVLGLTATGIPADYNGVPRTLIDSGLNFAAGTYYLVLDGPAGQFTNNGGWHGGASTVALDADFTLGSYFVTSSPTTFAPAANFATSNNRFVFEMDEVTAVPLPATLAMVFAGLVAMGKVGRRRTRAVG